MTVTETSSTALESRQVSADGMGARECKRPPTRCWGSPEGEGTCHSPIRRWATGAAPCFDGFFIGKRDSASIPAHDQFACASPQRPISVPALWLALSASTRSVTSAGRINSPWLLRRSCLPLTRSTSSFVWWGLHGQVSFPVEHAAIYVFLAVAFVLPFWVPFAMLGVETRIRRRRMIGALLVIGTITSVALLVAVIRGPVGASIDGSHIAYSADISYASILIVLYVVATCGSCLVASNKWLILLGLANLGAVIALGWITFTGFTSLWCAWAALTSVAIAVYLRRVARPSPSPDLVFQR